MCNVKNYFDASATAGHQKVLEDESPGEDNKFYYGVHKDLRLELQCVCVCVSSMMINHEMLMAKTTTHHMYTHTTTA